MFDDLLAQALEKAQQLAERGSAELHYLQKMIQSGAFGVEPPQNVAAMLADIRRWGEVGMIPALNARRTPHRTAIIDDEGDDDLRRTRRRSPTRSPTGCWRWVSRAATGWRSWPATTAGS